MTIKNVWIVVDLGKQNAGEHEETCGSYKTAAGAQRRYEALSRKFPFQRFEIRCESVAQ